MGVSHKSRVQTRIAKWKVCKHLIESVNYPLGLMVSKHIQFSMTHQLFCLTYSKFVPFVANNFHPIAIIPSCHIVHFLWQVLNLLLELSTISSICCAVSTIQCVCHGLSCSQHFIVSCPGGMLTFFVCPLMVLLCKRAYHVFLMSSLVFVIGSSNCETAQKT